MIHTLFLFLSRLCSFINRNFKGCSYRVYHGFQGDAVEDNGPRSCSNLVAEPTRISATIAIAPTHKPA